LRGDTGGCAFIFFSSLFTYSDIFRIDPHAAFAAPDDDENELPPHPDPLPQRGEGKKNKRIFNSFSLDGRR
jgi:hypothetical protein